VLGAAFYLAVRKRLAMSSDQASIIRYVAYARVEMLGTLPENELSRVLAEVDTLSQQWTTEQTPLPPPHVSLRHTPNVQDPT
jgi:hypothetical protein